MAHFDRIGGSLCSGLVAQYAPDYSTYLHYEAGAISNVAEAAVYTFLYKVDAIDVKPPLSRFQNTKFEKEDIFLLMQSINDSLKLSGETNLTLSALKKNFDLFYPLLEEELNKTPSPSHVKAKRTDKDILEELLNTVRSLLEILMNVTTPFRRKLTTHSGRN